MRKMYKTPQTETMPVTPTGIICSSSQGTQNVEVNNTNVNNVEIF